MSKKFFITFSDGSELEMESGSIYNLMLSLDGQNHNDVIKIEQIAERHTYLVSAYCYDTAQNYIKLSVDIDAYSSNEARVIAQEILTKLIAHRAEIVSYHSEKVV